MQEKLYLSCMGRNDASYQHCVRSDPNDAFSPVSNTYKDYAGLRISKRPSLR